MAHLVLAILLIAALGADARAAGTPSATCGQQKVRTIGRACASLLRAEAHHLSDGDAARRDRRGARVAARLRDSWMAASANELRGYIKDHVTTAMGRWAGHIAQWDVVNEPLPSILDPPTPDGLDDNVFRRLLGPGYVAAALQLARAADPTAKLYVNENGIEVLGPRQDGFFTLVQELLAAVDPRGIPDHGTDPQRWGVWVENACLAYAWNAGQRVSYWREEPLEVEGVLEGSCGASAIEVKTGRISVVATPPRGRTSAST